MAHGVDGSDALLAIAQIALGLAGFGGVFVALGRSELGARRPADTYRLVLLLSTALATLVLSLLPIAFRALGLADDAVWAAASALMAGLLVVLLAVAVRWRRRHRQEIQAGEAPLVAAAIFSLALLTLGAQLANAAGLLGAARLGVFLLGLVFLVAFGSYLFARMLFLWRS
jgi:hypothetical protein